MKKYILFFIVALVLVSCSVEPRPIDYGSDACSFCKMTIVDKQHATEIVTSKGKALKYDSIECMMRDLKNHKQDEIALYLVTDFVRPGNWVDANKATYLISENIPSPMGANLSAFKKRDEAEKVWKEETGELLDWSELRERF